jgi:AraC family transcriptional regulator
MEPKIITKKSFKVIGLDYYGENKNQEISGVWDKFNSICMTIPGASCESACYGVCYMEEGDTNPNAFHYLCAIEVNSLDKIPDGMKGIEIPEQKYALFTHTGKLDKLKETYDYIYQKWLPASGYKKNPLSSFDLELYDERFKFDSEDSQFDILISFQD